LARTASSQNWASKLVTEWFLTHSHKVQLLDLAHLLPTLTFTTDVQQFLTCY